MRAALALNPGDLLHGVAGAIGALVVGVLGGTGAVLSGRMADRRQPAVPTAA